MSFNPISVVLAVANHVITKQKIKKAERNARAAQEAADARARDANATRNINTSGSAVPGSLYFGYGSTAASNVLTDVSNNFTRSAASANENIFGNLQSFTGSKNETLITQEILGLGEITEMVNVDIDGEPISDDIYNNWSAVYVSKKGGIASPMGIANSTIITSNKQFNDWIYSTSAFKMNRDDPQFSGRPSIRYYFKGQPCYTISSSNTENSTLSFTTNAVNAVYTYSRLNYNAAPGFSTDDWDLENVRKNQVIADKTVMSSAAIKGRVYGSDTTRAIKKYEFNGSVNTASDYMSNFDTIIQSMPGAILFRDVYGKLKISLPDEDLTTSQHSVGTITDSDFILGESWKETYPDTNEKLNQVTVKFLNASLDFAEDSVTYIDSDFVVADGEPLSTTVFIPGIATKYTAEFAARSAVRESRRPIQSFTCKLKTFIYEPGDVVRIKSDTFDFDDYVRIQQPTLTPDLKVRFVSNQFRIGDFAWDADIADEDIPDRKSFDFTVEAPTNFTGTADNTATNVVAEPITLTWTAPDDINVNEVQIDGREGTNPYERLFNGDVNQTQFTFNPPKSGTWDFRIRSKTIDSRFSNPYVFATGVNSAAVGVDASIGVYVPSPIIDNNGNTFFDTDGVFDFTDVKTSSIKFANGVDSDTIVFNAAVLPNGEITIVATEEDSDITYRIVNNETGFAAVEATHSSGSSQIINFNTSTVDVELSDSDRGSSNAFFRVYRWDTNTPSVPGGGQVDFVNGAPTFYDPTGWTFDPGTGDGQLWTSWSQASITGITGTDADLTWSTPVLDTINFVRLISESYDSEGFANDTSNVQFKVVATADGSDQDILRIKDAPGNFVLDSVRDFFRVKTGGIEINAVSDTRRSITKRNGTSAHAYTPNFGVLNSNDNATAMLGIDANVPYTFAETEVTIDCTDAQVIGFETGYVGRAITDRQFIPETIQESIDGQYINHGLTCYIAVIKDPGDSEGSPLSDVALDSDVYNVISAPVSDIHQLAISNTPGVAYVEGDIGGIEEHDRNATLHNIYVNDGTGLHGTLSGMVTFKQVWVYNINNRTSANWNYSDYAITSSNYTDNVRRNYVPQLESDSLTVQVIKR